MNLHIDFETFSACDLKTAGLDNYAKHPSTGVHCMAYAFDDEPVVVLEANGRPNAAGVANDFHYPADREFWWHVKRGGLVYAHNAAFELAIWNNVCAPKYGWPPLKAEQCRCTMAMAYAMSLPGGLEEASNALAVGIAKDMKGARVMMQLAQPKADGSLWKPEDDPAKFQQLYDYCKQDVEVERALHARMMELSDEEQKLWTLDYTINQRGIQIDLDAVNAAIRLVAAEKARLDREMLRTTGGVVGSCTEVQLLVKWVRSQGVEVKGLAKADVLDALSGELPARVRAALNLRKEAAKSSTAKLIAMRDAASSDGRVRGALQYHGANTGRWAGRRVQFHNVPRPFLKPAQVDDAVAHFGDRDYLDIMYAPPLDVIVSCLRGMIVPRDGYDLVAADFANIESRVLAWLAGAEWKLDVFREYDAGTGPDIYLVAASWAYGQAPATLKQHRQEGKVIELGYGFGGGAGAAFTMAKTYNVDLYKLAPTVRALASDEMRDAAAKMWRSFRKKYAAEQEPAFLAGDIIKQFYRAKNPQIVRYWADLESAAINACELGVVCKSGPAGRQVQFKKNGSFLWCKLPSGRVLCYPYPVVKENPVPWGGTKPALFYWSVNGTTNKWEETNTYGGSLAENVTQAVARDLLADGMMSLEHHGYPVIMHVHDEIVVEIPSTSDDGSLKRIESLMSQTPSWAAGLPVTAEGWRARRYRK